MLCHKEDDDGSAAVIEVSRRGIVSIALIVSFVTSSKYGTA